MEGEERLLRNIFLYHLPSTTHDHFSVQTFLSLSFAIPIKRPTFAPLKTRRPFCGSTRVYLK